MERETQMRRARLGMTEPDRPSDRRRHGGGATALARVLGGPGAAICLFSLLAPLWGAAAAGLVHKVTISDPQGDVKKGVPTWQDLVSATVSAGKTGNFSFAIQVAAPIPASPTIASPFKLINWWFCLQVSSSFSVGGWPTSSSNGTGNQDPCQFFVVLYWDGTNFAGVVANRTPMLGGGDPVLTTIPYNVSSATVTWSIDRSLIGTPSSFSFFVSTEGRSNPNVRILSPTDVVATNSERGYTPLDTAPTTASGAFSFAQWP